MLYLISESNKDLKYKKFVLPNGIKSILKKTLQNYKGSKMVNGYKRLKNTLSADALSYSEMKRIKNFFDNYNGTDKSPEYILNGGKSMEMWVNNTLNTATSVIKNHKQTLKDMGVKNAFRKTHEKNRKIKPKKTTIAKMQTNNVSQHIKNNDIIKFESKQHIKKNNDRDIHYYLEHYGISYIVGQFLNCKGKGRINWEPLINPQSYKKALEEFTKFGKLIHFPIKYIYQWIGIIKKNTSILVSCTDIFGHSEYCPYIEMENYLSDLIENKYGNYEFDGINIITAHGNKITFDDFLAEIGFYKFMTLPNGDTACSDYGLKPLFKIINEYDSKNNDTPENTLITINKALDVYHLNGDLSSAFISGGKKSCDWVSETLSKKNICINEKQVKNIIKKLNETIYR